jgi:hypothetical protein
VDGPQLNSSALYGATIDSESLPLPDSVGLCDAAIRLTVQRTLAQDTDLLPLDLAHREARGAQAPGGCHSRVSAPAFQLGAGSAYIDGGRRWPSPTGSDASIERLPRLS